MPASPSVYDTSAMRASSSAGDAASPARTASCRSASTSDGRRHLSADGLRRRARAPPLSGHCSASHRAASRRPESKSGTVTLIPNTPPDSRPSAPASARLRPPRTVGRGNSRPAGRVRLEPKSFRCRLQRPELAANRNGARTECVDRRQIAIDVEDARHARNARAVRQQPRQLRLAAAAADAAASSEICLASASSCSALTRSNREPSPSFSRIRSNVMMRSISRIVRRAASSFSCSANSRATSVCASARSCHKRASRSASAAAIAAAPALSNAPRVPKIGNDCSTCRNSVNPAPSRLYATADSETRYAPPARGGRPRRSGGSRAPARRRAGSTQ